MKKSKSSNKRKLALEADKLFKRAILLTHKMECEICGGKADVAHHFVRRKNSARLVYDLDNGIALCGTCHFKVHNQPHYEAIALFKRDEEWYQRLMKKKQKVEPGLKTIKFYKEQIECLKKICQELDPKNGQSQK